MTSWEREGGRERERERELGLGRETTLEKSIVIPAKMLVLSVAPMCVTFAHGAKIKIQQSASCMQCPALFWNIGEIGETKIGANEPTALKMKLPWRKDARFEAWGCTFRGSLLCKVQWGSYSPLGFFGFVACFCSCFFSDHAGAGPA